MSCPSFAGRLRRGTSRLASLLLLAGAAAAQSTEIASLSSAGAQGNDASLHESALSADGRWLVFQSEASNLVPGDGNLERDIFLRDRLTGTTTRVSVSTAGAQANGSSYGPAISGDGRFVAFESDASNLVAGDTNSARDIFLRDTQAGTTTRVSVSSLGAQTSLLSSMAAISGDGSVLAFTSADGNLVPGIGNGAWQVFVHERLTGVTTLGSVALAGGAANGFCYSPSFSNDGRWLCFSSLASNLASADGDGFQDIFVRDRLSGVTVCSSVSTAGIKGTDTSAWPRISADGGTVAFQSAAANLVAGDTNGVTDIFARDLLSGETTRVSVSSSGAQGNGGSDGTSQVPALSADGRYVAFRSLTTNLAPNTIGWHAILLRDRLAGTTISLSLTPAGAGASADCHHPAMSADGRFVSFQSGASDLVAGDLNGGIYDIFVRGPLPVTWLDLGSALAGVAGSPVLKGSGTLAPGSAGTLALSKARPLAPATLFVSASSTPAPFKGGTLVPLPALLTVPLATSASGALVLPFVWPIGVPSGASFWFQMAIADPAAVKGVALSNALKGATP